MPATHPDRLVLAAAVLLACAGGPAHATTFIAQYVSPSAAPPAGQTLRPSTGALAPGLHVSVLEGMIVLGNSGGSQSFSAGQFGFVPNALSPPIIVPANSALRFTPPPTFSAQNPGLINSAQPRDSVDCEVR